MNQFDFLLIGHLIGDFLLQTGWMAKNKTTRWWPLLVHVTVYTSIVTLAGWLSGGIGIWVVVLIFVSHVLLDRKGFVGWWSRRIQGITRKEDTWVIIMTDQVFHITILAIAAAISN